MAQGDGGRPTIYAVAASAGVSIATVSRVLSRPELVAGTTRQRVQAAIEELGYVPEGAARALAARQNHALGLVLPEMGGPYYAELLSGFEAAAADHEASVVVTLTNGKQDVDSLVRGVAGRVDALAVMGNVAVRSATVHAVRTKVPLIVFAGERGDGMDVLTTENMHSSHHLTHHLLDHHARRRLLFIGDPSLAPDLRERYAGFCLAHTERGLRPAEPVKCRPTESEGHRVGDLLASGELATDGAVCANDELALAVQQRLQAGGLDVPGQVAVTGWDDVLAARYVTPALTTVRQPVRDFGRLIAARLQELLGHHRPSTVDQHLPTTVIIRHSCGCS